MTFTMEIIEHVFRTKMADYTMMKIGAMSVNDHDRVEKAEQRWLALNEVLGELKRIETNIDSKGRSL